MTTEAKITYVAPKLEGKESYPAWAFAMKIHLKTAGLWAVIYNNAQKTETKTIEQQCQEALTMLVSTISRDEMLNITHCQLLGEIWTHFENTYGKRTGNLIQDLHNEIHNLTCNSNDDVKHMLTKIRPSEDSLRA